MDTTDDAGQIRYAGRHRVVDHRAPSVAGFDVTELIGAGGSGEVWAATDARGDTVAIKVVAPADSEDALVELAVLARIEDPHLVRMHEARALPGGGVALVLEHCAGGSLGSVVRARGHLGPGEAVTVLSPIASTLGRLHGLGVVHGDVSPGNVLLDLDGRPLLTDLGVARIAGDRAADLRGTEGFIAPEVALGHLPTSAADVHALGALAWFCLVGEVPGPAVVRGRLLDRAPDVPPELAVVIEGALRTRPEDRPDADTVATALFESAPAEPLQLVRGGDDVSLLTRRIREAARAQSGMTSDRSTGATDRGLRQRLMARGAVLRSRLAGCVARVGARLRAAAATTVRAVRWAGPLLAVFVAAGAVTAGVMAWTGVRDDAKANPSRTVASTPARPAVPQQGAEPPDVRLAEEVTQDGALALVQALADARARVWSAGKVAGLGEVDAPRSPALQRDTEVLAGVQLAKQRYVGLTFTARDATVVSARDDRATIRTRIDTGAHVVSGPGGDERRAAQAASPVLLDLVRTPSGWRVHEVRSVAE